MWIHCMHHGHLLDDRGLAPASNSAHPTGRVPFPWSDVHRRPLLCLHEGLFR